MKQVYICSTLCKYSEYKKFKMPHGILMFLIRLLYDHSQLQNSSSFLQCMEGACSVSFSPSMLLIPLSPVEMCTFFRLKLELLNQPQEAITSFRQSTCWDVFLPTTTTCRHLPHATQEVYIVSPFSRCIFALLPSSFKFPALLFALPIRGNSCSL